MMRSAKEILHEVITFGLETAVIDAINIAREEAIRECAEKFVINDESLDVPAFIEEESIYNLIKELK